MNAATTSHLSLEQLLDYWLHDSDAAATDAADEHLMQCDACGALLDELVALGDAARAAFRAGAVPAAASGAFVRTLAERGVKVREYRLPHNGSVNCTVAPDDELLVSRLEAPLQGVERLDATWQLSLEPGVQRTRHDIPFDPRAGEVLFVAKLAEVRRLPEHTMEVTLLAVEPGATREIGRYTFRHRPWPAT
jgi:hypothetical protein